MAASIKAGVINVYGDSKNVFTDGKQSFVVPTAEEFAADFAKWEAYVEQLEEVKKEAVPLKAQAELRAMPGYDPEGPKKDAARSAALKRKLFQWERTNAKVAALHYCQTQLLGTNPIKTHDDALAILKHHWVAYSKFYDGRLEAAAKEGNTIAVGLKSYGL